MKAFWYQSLVIYTAIVAVGCVGPQAKLSFEERLSAEGYPEEYVDGFKAGYESFCAETFSQKSRHPFTWEFDYCKYQSIEVKTDKKARNSKSYQQGRHDGGSVAGLTALRLRQQVPYYGYYMLPQIDSTDTLNMQIPELNK